MISQSTVKFDILDLSPPSTFIAYSFLTKKVTKTRLTAFERAEKMLSEQHEFCPTWFKNSDTVISQSTVKFDYSVLSPPSTLIAYSS